MFCHQSLQLSSLSCCWTVWIDFDTLPMPTALFRTTSPQFPLDFFLFQTLPIKRPFQNSHFLLEFSSISSIQFLCDWLLLAFEIPDQILYPRRTFSSHPLSPVTFCYNSLYQAYHSLKKLLFGNLMN